jgi:hypothetical protein
MNKIVIILVYVVLSNTNGCTEYKDPNCNEKTHNAVWIINNSERNICFKFYWNYPDTLIGEYNPIYGGPRANLSPNDSFAFVAGPRGCCCYESSYSNGRKEWIYIFDSDTLVKLDWEIVRTTNRGLLERRIIDLTYLQENNFRIIYQ